MHVDLLDTNEIESPVSYSERAVVLRSGVGWFETRAGRPPLGVTGFTWLSSVSPGTYRYISLVG